MSCIQPAIFKSTPVDRMSSLEIMERFRNEHRLLLAMTHLITGNLRNAENTVSKARELMTHSVIPFMTPGQLTKWIRWVTIKAAVADNLDEIKFYEPTYCKRSCTHADHLLQGNLKLQQFHDFLLHLQPATVITELDPLARAVAVLRGTSRVSILDCALPLKLSVDTVLAANCRAMTWIAEKRNEAEGEQVPPQKTVRTIHGHNYAPVRKWRKTLVQLHVDN